MERDRQGFTIIELLIVVAVIGILAAIAVPSLMAAVHRGRQKRTMADVRSIAVAVETYASDNDGFPALAPGPSASGLQALLQPTYMRSVPRQDAWGHPLLYEGTDAEYTLISYGKDGLSSGPLVGPTTDFDDDLVFSMGAFIAWPEGVQD